MLRIILVLAYMITATHSYADTVQSGSSIFTGPNIYSPTVVYDYQESSYKMWYGGWQVDTQRRDSIYYKISSDGINWPSGYIEVLTADFVAQRYAATTGQSIAIEHVNDPSVTKHFNITSNTYQYTMFFTVCLANTGSVPCERIWSVVSNDGTHWDFPKPAGITLPTGVIAPQNPSIIIDTTNPNNVFWHLYFSASKDPNSNTGVPNQVFLVYVNGNRSAYTSAASVLNPGITVQNPSVMILGSTWYVFFNTINTTTNNGFNIYYSKSNTNNWSGSTPIVVNNGNTFCSSNTPGVIPLNSTTYNLYFSLIQYGNTPGIPCDFTKNTIMEVFRITSP